MRGTRRVRRAVVPVLLLAGAALLSGCTSNPVGAVVTPAATSSATTAAPAPTPTTPPPTQVAADATPVDVRCSKLVPKAVAQQLLPDLALEKGWVPTPASAVYQLAQLRGTACAWTDDAGDRVEVGVARPSRADAVALKNDLVRRSNSVPTYGGEAYFRILDHLGRVSAFRGRTWIFATSNRFFEPGDAVPVMRSIDAALGFAKASEPAESPAPSVAPTPGETAPAPPAAQTPAPTPTP